MSAKQSMSENLPSMYKALMAISCTTKSSKQADQTAQLSSYFSLKTIHTCAQRQHTDNYYYYMIYSNNKGGKLLKHCKLLFT